MSESPQPPMSAIKLALMARKAREQFANVVRAEPIAIVGAGCRFPGGADNPDAYWNLLCEGVDAVREIPGDRWDVDAMYDPDPAVAGKSSARHAGLLDRIDTFDAGFFGILPREASRMDPQQRVFMEVAINALDDAGLTREQLAGTRTGVYVASYHNDYTLMQYADPEWIDPRTLTGTLHSVIANRLSHLLDLRGPSVSLDTACSSSLVAVHLACQSLRAGESDIALAGGVSIIAAPDLMIALTKVGFTSATGRCRTFDARADGFVRGEGCGVVVLKRLGDAIAAGDPVIAVIRSSVVNQDGHSTVMAAPSGLAQQALVREALQAAQLAPERVGFVETHGTATPLGDPIEVEALAHVVGAPRADGSVCHLGSVKANIGHLEAAAGVAGLIKAALVLRHGEIPRQVHFEKPNPHLMLDGTCLRIPATQRPWPRGNAPRVAGVSSFGVGGTNAHVLLEEAPVLPAPPAGPVVTGPVLLPLSAQSEAALRELATEWLGFLGGTSEQAAPVCAAAALRRSHYDYRLALVGASTEQLASRLRQFLAEGPGPHAVAGNRLAAGPGRLAFVFSGQGPQWFAMGRELLGNEPVFAQALREVDALLLPLSGWSLLAELAADEQASRLDETERAQPALFGIQVALTALWKSWGIEPDGVVGHSIGELAALHVAGVLALAEAVRLVWLRASAMQKASPGAMAAVALDGQAASELVAPFGNALSIGAFNSPGGVVLSGRADALETALQQLDARGVTHRALAVKYAFHSAQMQPLATQFEAAAGRVQAAAPHLSFYSTVSGAAEGTKFDAGYFARNVRQPVRFAQAIDAMLADGFNTFLEIGPHPVLAGSIAECAAARGISPTLLASLRRQRSERETMLQACAGLYASQWMPRWAALNAARPARIPLPAYPWQRERYWLRERPAGATTAGRRVSDLLGSRVPAGSAHIFEASWPAAAPAWLADHRVGGRLLVPAAAMLEALREAACEADGRTDMAVRDFTVHRPLVLSEKEGEITRWQVSARKLEDGNWRLELHELDALDASGQTWRLVASGRSAAPAALPDIGAMAAIADDDAAVLADRYAAFDAVGVQFGPAFRTLRAVRPAEREAHVLLALQTVAQPSAGLHPTLLDGALQACVVAATGAGGQARELLLPMGVDHYELRGAVPGNLLARVRWHREHAGGSLQADVILQSSEGTVLAVIEGARFAPTTPGDIAAGTRNVRDLLYEVAWGPAARLEAATDAAGAWLVLADAQGTAEALAAQLESSGAVCVRLQAAELPRAAALLRDAAWRKGRALAGVVHCQSLDLPTGMVPVAQDERAEELAGISALVVFQQMLEAAVTAPLILVTSGAQPAGGPVSRPAAAALWGLHATILAEHPDFACHVFDLDGESVADDAAALAAELRCRERPARLALRGNRRLIPRLRHLAAPEAQAQPVSLHVDASGLLDAMQWRPVDVPPPARGEVRVRVAAAGLNFRDVLLALGMYPGGMDIPLGAECAGVVEAVGPAVQSLAVGDAVFGFAPGGLASVVNVPAAFLAGVPGALTIEQAASTPVAFLTAMYGLEHIAGLKSGMSVLIHAAAGGVGMAAVQLALQAGATVFATAGSPAKRALLQAMGVQHVLDSRSLQFADDIRQMTDGRGVDVVLNSLAGDFIEASVASLAAEGCFLELGKRDTWSPQRFAATRPHARYAVYDLGTEALADRQLLAPMLQRLVADLESGALRPLPLRVFGFHEAEEAFRFMAQARHVGKIALRAAPSSAAARQPAIRADATYLVTGGLGAIGRHTAAWLIKQGARHLLLTSRGHPDEALQRQLEAWCATGIDVQIRAVDVGDYTALSGLLEQLRQSMPPLRGVFHAAGVLDDGVLAKLDAARWRKVLHGKARGAHHLHRLTAGMPLDLFVLYSAAGLLLGPAGQGAYAAANAELDALAQARRAAGLPATSVAWGMWGEGGMAARNDNSWSQKGLGWIGAEQGFAALALLLRLGVAHAAVLAIDWNRFLSRSASPANADWFAGLAATAAVAPDTRVDAGRQTIEVWRAAAPARRRELVAAHLHDKALSVLGLDSSVSIGARIPLKEAGLDSLMAVEMRNVLTRSVGRSLPATLLFDYPTLDALATYLMRVLELDAGSTAAPFAAGGSARSAMAELSDAEAEAQLMAELDGSSAGGKE